MPADNAPTQTDDDLPDEEPTSGQQPAAAQKPARQPQPAAPAAEPKKPAHSPMLLKAAAKHGFAPEDLDGYSAEEVWEELHRLDSLEAAKPQPQRAAEPPAPAAPPADPDEQYLAELEKVDPGLARLHRRQMEKQAALEKQLAEKDEALKTLTAAEQKRQVRAWTKAVDAAFAALPEKFLPLVGEGGIEQLTDPGHKGWRGAIYQKAGLADTDGVKAIAAKIARAAEEVAGQHVKEPAAASAYDRAANGTPKAPKPERERDTNGRFTAGDFHAGLVHRPTGRQTGPDKLDDVEQARRAFREAGDPRGSRPVLEITDDDLPDDD